MSATAPKFPVDREAFLERIAKELRLKQVPIQTRETTEVVKSHLSAFGTKVSNAYDAIRDGNLGNAKAFLQIALHDYNAAIACLPDRNPPKFPTTNEVIEKLTV